MVALVATTALCSSYEGAPSGPTVATGLWGGDHLSLNVTTTGAQADFDCAHGAISEPMALDRSGRFDVAGTFTQESPGPQREGQGGQDRPARYAGRVQGSTMTVTMTVTESREVIGPFTLTRGSAPRITKCR